MRQFESVPSGQRHVGFSGRDTPSFEILNTCVKCGLCLPTCPTYRETMREQSSPRGRIHLMQGVADGRLDVLNPTFVEQMYECLDCRACEAVCPSGVLYGEVVEAARAQIERARRSERQCGVLERAVRAFVFAGLFADLRLLRTAAAVLRLYQRSGLRALARGSGLLRRLGLADLEAKAPQISERFFVPRGQVFPAFGERRGRVALLAGCVMHTAFAEVDRATVRVLTRNGWEVTIPAAQGCCGALHIHAGEIDGGRERARQNISAFEDARPDLIVNNAAGCGAALKEYGRLLADDSAWSARAESFTTKVRDVTELLASRPLRGCLRRLDLTVTYQDACHLAHAQGITSAPRQLLAAIPGLKLVEMEEPALCCGSAGVYSVTHPEMAAGLLERKLDHALVTKAEVIASANPGCILQLRNGLRGHRESEARRTEVKHIVEILDAAYGA